MFGGIVTATVLAVFFVPVFFVLVVGLKERWARRAAAPLALPGPEKEA